MAQLMHRAGGSSEGWSLDMVSLVAIMGAGLRQPPHCVDIDSGMGLPLFRKPDGMSVNLEAVRLGWAEADADDFRDNREDVYRNYEARARYRYVGIWAADKPKPADHSDNDTTAVYVGDSMYHKYEKCGKFQYVSPQGYGARGFTVTSARHAQFIPCPKCKPNQ